MPKPIKKPNNKKDSIIGVLQLFTVISIGYMSYIVILGTEGLAPKIMTVPAIAWAATVLVKRFTK